MQHQRLRPQSQRTATSRSRPAASITRSSGRGARDQAIAEAPLRRGKVKPSWLWRFRTLSPGAQAPEAAVAVLLNTTRLDPTA